MRVFFQWDLQFGSGCRSWVLVQNALLELLLGFVAGSSEVGLAYFNFLSIGWVNTVAMRSSAFVYAPVALSVRVAI